MTAPEPGRIERMADGIRRLLAPNPGPMTHWGTNTYVLGEGTVAIVDPGPDDAAHLAALLDAVRGERVTHILVTHAHRDHSGAAPALAAATGAPICGFGPPHAGRSPVMQALAAQGDLGGGEGVDGTFMPDMVIDEGDVVDVGGEDVEVLHTPGHFAGHLAFGFGEALFCGDHVMEWSTSLVSPPDGDLTRFLETSERLRGLDFAVFHSGHGAPIHDPAGRLDTLIAHRRARESRVLDALTGRPEPVDTLLGRAYADVPPEFHPAARRNLLAHLVDLVERNLATADPSPGLSAHFRKR